MEPIMGSHIPMGILMLCDAGAEEPIIPQGYAMVSIEKTRKSEVIVETKPFLIFSSFRTRHDRCANKPDRA